jgi:hypothetical protein
MTSALQVRGMGFALSLIAICRCDIYILRVFRIRPVQRETWPEFSTETARGEIGCQCWRRSLLLCNVYFVRHLCNRQVHRSGEHSFRSCSWNAWNNLTLSEWYEDSPTLKPLTLFFLPTGGRQRHVLWGAEKRWTCLFGGNETPTGQTLIWRQCSTVPLKCKVKPSEHDNRTFRLILESMTASVV